jgi:channel protein (hemolysin III family)
MIAGTYTPLTVRLPGARSVGLTAGIWSAAVAGVAAKLCQPRRVEAMSVALYLSAGLGRRGRRRTAAGVVQRPHAASSTRQG